MLTDIDLLRQRVITRIEKIIEFEQGYRVIFPNEESILVDLQRFTTHEAECCTFLDFNVTYEVDQLICIVTVKQYDLDVAKEIIQTLFSTS